MKTIVKLWIGQVLFFSLCALVLTEGFLRIDNLRRVQRSEKYGIQGSWRGKCRLFRQKQPPSQHRSQCSRYLTLFLLSAIVNFEHTENFPWNKTNQWFEAKPMQINGELFGFIDINVGNLSFLCYTYWWFRTLSPSLFCGDWIWKMGLLFFDIGSKNNIQLCDLWKDSSQYLCHHV